MPAAWHCGGVAPIRADAARQGCATFRIALLAPLLGAAPEGVAYLARNRWFESISLQQRVSNEPRAAGRGRAPTPPVQSPDSSASLQRIEARGNPTSGAGRYPGFGHLVGGAL